MSHVPVFLVVELAVIVFMTLVVGTFAPPLDRWLPWSRAYRRWRSRRVAARIHALERRATPVQVPEPQILVTGYRDNAAVGVETTLPEPSLMERYRARRDARFVARLEADAEDVELAEPSQRNARV